MNDPIGPQLSSNEWVIILQNSNLTREIDLLTLIEFANSEDSTESGSKIAPKVGLKNVGTINLNFFRFADRISKKYEIKFLKYKGRNNYWRLFFNGYQQYGFYFWQVRSEILEALIQIGKIAESDIEKNYLIDEHETFIEGAKSIIESTVYKRNEKARAKCISIYGCKCYICEFNFEKNYGKLGKGFIHVHHKKIKAYSGDDHEINPVDDLIPLCPNCHSMIHKKKPMLKIDQLKEIMKNQKSK